MVIRRQAFQSGPGKQEALEELDAFRPEPGVFVRRLDTLGDDVDPEIPAGSEDAADDRLARASALDAADDLHVQLDEIRLELG